MKPLYTKSMNQREIILPIFERSWGEVDWILPVLFQLKEISSNHFSIIPIFLPEWKKVNQTITSITLYNEIKQVADKIIYLDQQFKLIKDLPNEKVKFIISDGNPTTSKLYIYRSFPFAKKIWFPHGVFLHYKQEFNRLRRFNLLEDFEKDFEHDLMLCDTQHGAEYYFDGHPFSKVCIKGTPRFDKWWINRLLSSQSFLESMEINRANSAKRVFLFTTTTPLREFPPEIFFYVLSSVAEVILKDKDNYLLIRPHPRQPLSQISELFNKYDNRQWTISSLHLIQLSSLCDLAISVHSGAIIDILSTGKPVIEFAQYIQPTDCMTINQHGHLQSLYTTLNLSVHVRTKEDLKKYIDHYFYDADRTIWDKQQQNFKNLFLMDNNASQRTALEILRTVLSENNKERNNIQRSWSPITGERQMFLKTSKAHYSMHLQIKRIKGAAMPICSLLLNEIAKVFGTDVFIATGTFSLNMAYEAAKIFREVHFIESASDLYQPLKFKKLQEYDNVHIYHSARFLKLLLPDIKGKILFWLSSHDSAAITFKNKTNTPVVEELQVIKHYNINNSVILINNIRHFQPIILDGFEAEKVRKYPEIQEAINNIDSSYDFFIIGDIAFAYPPTKCVTVSDGLRAFTLSRIFNGKNLNINSLLEAENYIASKLIGQEKEAVKAMYSDYYSLEEPGTGAHFRLWSGLISMGEGDFARAKSFFIKTIKRGLNHWRVGWYLAQAAYKTNDIPLAKEMANAVNQTVPNFQEVKTLLNILK